VPVYAHILCFWFAFVLCTLIFTKVLQACHVSLGKLIACLAAEVCMFVNVCMYVCSVCVLVRVRTCARVCCVCVCVCVCVCAIVIFFVCVA